MNHCKKCDQVDTDYMVQCDKCDCWYHFSCVGVDSNVADVSWNCDLCDHSLPVTSAESRQTSTAISDNRPRAWTSSSPVAETTGSYNKHVKTTWPRAAQSLTHTNNEEYMRPLAEIYTATVPISGNIPPVSSETTTTAIMPVVLSNDALSNIFSTALSEARATTVTSSLPATRPLSSTQGHNFQNNFMMATPAPTTRPLSTTQGHNLQNNFSMATPAPKIANKMGEQQERNFAKRNLELQRLEENFNLQQQFLETKYRILAQMEDLSPSTQFNVSACVPTAAQLAARQAIPKNLPNFSGSPEDWPLFISTFENSTVVAGFSNAENLVRLQACLKGKARDLVKSRLCIPSMVPEIIDSLRMCFGRPEHIIEQAIIKARSMPSVKDKLESLIEYALCVKNICATMESCKMDMHLHNPFLIKELLEKLPSQHKLSWAMYPKDERIPIVRIFSDWLYQMAEAASTVVSLAPTKGNANVNTHVVADESDKTDKPQSNALYNKCVICKSNEHKITECTTFKNATLNRRWEYAEEKSLCRRCLGKHRKKCYVNKPCGIDGCEGKHHQLLHRSKSNQVHNQGEQQAQVNAHNKGVYDSQPYFRVLPITIHAMNKFLKTFAFLDEGSAVTLIEHDIFEELGIQGKRSPLCLKWTGGTTRTENDSVTANITISTENNGRRFELKEVQTVKNLDLPVQSLNASKMAQIYPHLKGLPLNSFSNAKPKILIGINNWKLALPLKVKEGKRNDPMASKCRLGWTIQGFSPGYSKKSQLNFHTCDCQQFDQDIHDAIKETFNIDNPKPTQLLSSEDDQAVRILEETCKKVDGHYEVGLPWRDNQLLLPDSYSNALNRLMCLKKKFIKEPELKTIMQIQVNNLVQKGYAYKLSEEELQTSKEKTWYLPTFIVRNPNKPEKVRLVWDAASKSNGNSLNDFLLSGPDLLTSLIQVLMAFRVGKVAVCGDISEMFHRIHVREADMHTQRFLWWDTGDKIDHPSTYVMRALTFGLSCAPFIAHFVRNKNAEQFRSAFPRAVEAVCQYHYVDDFIDSETDETTATELALRVREIHLATGFNVKNWASNSKEVLKHLEADSTSGQSPREWGSTTKVLGMYWDPLIDMFKYIFRFARLRRDVINEQIIPTKRETLQVLMSIFDPLGFVAYHTTDLKILLQDIWRSGINWDEPLPENLYAKWCQWKAIIPAISAVRVPRCYSPFLTISNDVQLHTFVDAGENAYAAVCYLRVAYASNVHVSLVAAKSKVSPLKPISIPRLELQAAVIGVRLASKVLNVNRIRTTKQFYWTDSKTTLKWLRLDPKSFHQFVMHRVAEILDSTNLSQWNWVPSKMNPADLATKVPRQRNYDMWFSGPKFLLQDTSKWPRSEPLNNPSEDDVELRHRVLVIQNTAVRSPDVEYFSCWRRLLRAVATFILFIKKTIAIIRKIPKPQHISKEMYICAKIYLIKFVQAQEFSEEIASLKCGKPIKMSKLISLNLYIDEDGVMRSRGREEWLNNHDDAIVLPQYHWVTFLIVRWFHERLHHQMHETIINHIRGRYYIRNLRVLYKNMRNKCQICKNNSTKPNVPQMAPLPTSRLAAFQRPFTYVGIDYFGPFFTTVGRRREKRWGVIFTCLTVRAIHIEMAHTLDTSSCVMAIRNFIARRGWPSEIYSDNGTNFKAAEKIYSEQLKWRFNPPAAPHMGGAWERLIRSIKNVLYSICPLMKFNDETLRCSLNEIEFIINSRPLTFVSIESTDDEAITPNHLLLGSTDGFKPSCDDGVDLRQRWHQTQKFADQFWRRWVKEYIPVISRRQKWHNKQPPIKIGDIVVVTDPSLPRNSWPKGIVIDVHVAKDGQTRSVTIKTKTGIYQRPVVKVAVLDVGKADCKLAETGSFTGKGMLPP